MCSPRERLTSLPWSTLLPLVIAVTIFPAGPALAQGWEQPWSDPRDRPPRVDLSASVGLLMPSDWSDLVLVGLIGSNSGLLEQVIVRDMRVEPGTVFGGAVTYWQGRYGFRAQGARASSSLTIGGASPGAFRFPSEGETASIDIDTWLYDVRAAIGMFEYTPQRWVWPYAFVGFGGITYDLSRTVSPPLLTIIEGGGGRAQGGEIAIFKDEGRQFLLAVDELGLETVFAVNFGVGTDFRIPSGPASLGLRVELSDHISPSPLGLRIREFGPAGVFGAPGTVHFGAVHHLRAAAGLVVQIGR